MENSKIEETQETRNEETQETHPWTYSTTNEEYEEYSVKSKAPKENVIILWLKRIFNIKVLGTIAGIIAAVAAVLALLPTNPVASIINPIASLKKEITEKATIIKDSFRPNEIQIDSLSSPDIQLVKDFQIAALRVAEDWYKINAMEPIAKYNTADLKILLNAILSRLDVINAFDNETKNVQASALSIVNYGKENNIPQYVRGADKLTDLYLKAGKRDAYFSKTKQTLINDFTILMTESVTDPNSITNKKVVKVIAPLDKIYNNKEVLDYTNTLFSWIIEVNRDYMDYLKYSKSK